jgi:beta-glucanase (GH16 family)
MKTPTLSDGLFRFRLLIVFLGVIVQPLPAQTPANVDKLPPAAPLELTAQSGGDAAIPLKWTASAEATSYTIFRSNTQNDTNTRQVAANVVGTSFTNTGLKNDSTYYFKIKAVNASGASVFSGEVSATTKITGQPLPDGIYTLAPRNAPRLRLQSNGPAVSAGLKIPANSAQQWKLTSVNLATYRLSPVDAPVQALDVHDQSGANAAKVETSDYQARASQQWTLTPVSGGYRLTPTHATSLALNFTGEADGSAVNQLTNADLPAQTWIILPLPEGGSDGMADPGPAYVPAGYKLVFSDEFDGPTIDLKKWETLAPYSQPHLNDEIECYSPEGVILQNGVCVLRAEKVATTCGEKFPWRSGAITSRATYRHAYYEARVKVPQGVGMWPAFWTTSSKRWPPEWDFFEIQNTVGTLYQYMHPTRAAKMTWIKGAIGRDSVYTTNKGMPNPYDGYVIYGAEVTPKGVTLWINGKLTAQWEVSGDTIDPMWVNCELAVGGKWAGAPDDTTPAQNDMLIDYVRVYQSPEVETEVQAILAAQPKPVHPPKKN